MDGCLFRLICALLFVGQSAALADQVNNEWLSSTRARSMGNVGIANADEAVTTMFYNPAGLSRLKKTTVEIFNPQLEIGTGVFKVTPNGTKFGSNLSLTGIQPELAKYPHKASYMGYSLFPNVMRQSFGFGIAWKEQAVSYLNSQDKLEYHSQYLMIPTMGLSTSLFGGLFRLGGAVRGIQVTQNDRVVDADATGIGYKKDAREGFGLGGDVGATISLPLFGIPTFAFVARNIGDTTFTAAAPLPRGEGSVTLHEKIKMTYDTGFSLQPKVGRGSFTLAADFRDMLNATNTNMLRHLNLGTEFGMGKAFFLRFGFSQGYFSAGFGLNSKFGSFDLGTYGEELDARNFREIQDRRVSMRFAVKF